MNSLAMITRLFSLLAVVVALLSPTLDAAAATTPEQVRKFVHAVYIEGVPYEQASQLAPDVALPVLEQVLRDPREEEFWANAAITIGMIGHDQGVDLLMEFITRREAKPKLSHAQTVAKTSAVMALGYIVNKTGNRKALDFLKTGVDPKTWRTRKLAWTGEFHGTGKERDKQLAVMAALGLGVSGNPEAAQILRSLGETPKTRQMRALKRALPEIDNVADEALKANNVIASKGIQNYYLKGAPACPYGPEQCKPGFVWREAFAGDKVCVSGEVRTQTAQDNAQAAQRRDPNGTYGPNTCTLGYVWREAGSNDQVCVTGAVRDQAAADNAQAAARRDPDCAQLN